ncbi:hypothetical protein GIB67_024897 [Kingdonia uniflora]|uniref:Meiosis-specific protein ASY3-like coiled-coil domain-containing protein n=1 Tax=Kingdonia uniflora TaxID=39325 RepID=A0A7J7NYL4_9MAGN|nr:hypothetical protein GIB67_024897 [Kingdonia uniflora]
METSLAVGICEVTLLARLRKEQWDGIEDQTSECRNFGSSYLPCSQTRKISIGVMADDPAKPRPVPRKQDEIALPSRASSSGGRLEEENCKTPGSAIVHLKENQSDAPRQGISPWISTKSLPEETPVTKTVQFYAKRTRPIQPDDDVGEKSNNQSETPVTKNTVQGYANRTSFLQSEDGVRKTFDSVTYGRTRKEGRNTERVEEFTFAAAAQEVHILDKRVEENTSNKSNSVLRKKLWEILGTAPSQNEQNLSSQIPEVVVKEDLKSVGNFDQKGNKAAKSKQNSDTIETDSESPNQTTRRPVTRSLTRKKVPTIEQRKLSYKKSNEAKVLPSSSLRRSCQEKNIFTFDEAEGRLGILHGTINGRSSACMGKKSGGSSRVTPRKLSFSGKSNQDKNLQTNEKNKLPPPAKRTTSLSTREGSFHSHLPQNNENVELYNTLAREKRDQHEDFTGPQLPRAESPHEDFYRFFSKKNQDTNCNANSPTYGMKAQTPTKNWSPSPPSPKSKSTEKSKHSPEPAENRSMEGFCSSKNIWSSKPRFFGRDNQKESSDNTKDLSVSPIKELSPILEKKVSSEDRLSQSSSSEEDAESLEEDSPTKKVVDHFAASAELFSSKVVPVVRFSVFQSISTMVNAKKGIFKAPTSNTRFDQINGLQTIVAILQNIIQWVDAVEGYKAAEIWSPEINNPVKPSFMFRPSKRLCSEEGIGITEISPSPSQKCTQKSNDLLGASDQSHEDGLSRAVAIFALALEKLKTKMELQTSKKSSEILASVAEKIQLQLQNVETQIQTDMKFTNLGKSKRKRLESRFQEQQERLNLIRQKLIEEVNQHLQDSKNTFEELESYHRELKGNAEKQKASHKKLLLQVEEAIGTQLTDAERRIMTLQKASEPLISSKHFGTKYV